jgi:hypothetical protein
MKPVVLTSEMNMRLIRVVLLLCIAAGNVSSRETDPNPVPKQTGSNLQLKTEVVNQTYCERGNLRVILRFTFLNRGSEPLILYRYATVIARYVVSKDLKSLAKGKYESDVSPMINPRMPPEVEKGTPSEELFVILKPGESYATTTDGYLGINDGSDASVKLRAGRYFLQLQVAMWYTDPARARELRERWREMGTLWYYDVTSLPMEITIKPYNPGDTCS